MKDKRHPPIGSTIDPELKREAEKQLRDEIALIEHWIGNTEPHSKFDIKAAQLNAKYKDMLRSRQDMLTALQKQFR